MEIKNNLTVTTKDGGGRRGMTGKRRVRVKSRNMYKGPMGKDDRGEERKWKVGIGWRRGESWGQNGDNCT